MEPRARGVLSGADSLEVASLVAKLRRMLAYVHFMTKLPDVYAVQWVGKNRWLMAAPSDHEFRTELSSDGSHASINFPCRGNVSVPVRPAPAFYPEMARMTDRIHHHQA